jgi:hypothetical protein
VSAAAPYTVGKVADIHGLSWAFSICAVAFLFASLMAWQLPETKGKILE